MFLLFYRSIMNRYWGVVLALLQFMINDEQIIILFVIISVYLLITYYNFLNKAIYLVLNVVKKEKTC